MFHIYIISIISVFWVVILFVYIAIFFVYVAILKFLEIHGQKKVSRIFKEPVLNYQVFKPFYARLPPPHLNYAKYDLWWSGISAVVWHLIILGEFSTWNKVLMNLNQRSGLLSSHLNKYEITKKCIFDLKKNMNNL